MQASAVRIRVKMVARAIALSTGTRAHADLATPGHTAKQVRHLQ